MYGAEGERNIRRKVRQDETFTYERCCVKYVSWLSLIASCLSRICDYLRYVYDAYHLPIDRDDIRGQ